MKTAASSRARSVAVVLAIMSAVLTVFIGILGVACRLPYAPDPGHFATLVHAATLPEHSWRAIHVLAADCRCSRNVAHHLAERGNVPGLHESAVLVGHDPEIVQLVKAAKFPLLRITSSESSERYHIEGAPWLILVDPDDRVAYAGGYAVDRNARDGYHDIAVWRTVSSGKVYDPLPVYGCATGARARRDIDPLGLLNSWMRGRSQDDKL